jgi:DNA-binding NtrC family response regulator
MVRINDIPAAGQPRAPRLNLLLSCRQGQEEGSAIDQLPRLLEPMGIRSFRVATGEGAARVISDNPIHIAVVDLTIPLVESAPARPGGARILQLLRRLDQPPPTVVVRPREPAGESARSLAAALREGAFTVLDRPIQLETMLEVMRRILRRYYADLWPI